MFVLQICVVTNALHTLCISMYHYDCFYICKDLTEGEINQSINQPGCKSLNSLGSLSPGPYSNHRPPENEAVLTTRFIPVHWT